MFSSITVSSHRPDDAEDTNNNTDSEHNDSKEDLKVSERRDSHVSHSTERMCSDREKFSPSKKQLTGPAGGISEKATSSTPTDDSTTKLDQIPRRPERREVVEEDEESLQSPTAHSTSPPNVTVVQPTVTHPMFSYLYHPGGLFSGNSLPLHMGHMLFGGGNNSVGPGSNIPLGFLPSTDLSHLPQSAAQAAGFSMSAHNMVLNGQFAALGHPFWHPGYAAAFGHSAAAGLDGMPTSHPSLHGALSAARTLSNSRYSPYSLPSTTKTTMVTTATPLAVSGVTSPLRTSSPITSPTSHRSISPGSPRPTSSKSSSVSTSAAASELKSIERMVNGLEKQQEKLAVETLTKLDSK